MRVQTTAFRATEVSVAQSGKRLDLVLQEVWGFSRREVRRLCEDGLVLFNGHLARRGFLVKQGDGIQVSSSAWGIANSVEREVLLRAELKRVRVAYQDADLAVLSKPRLMHSVTLKSKLADPSSGISLAECLEALLTETKGPETQGLAGREQKAVLQAGPESFEGEFAPNFSGFFPIGLCAVNIKRCQ